MVFARLGKFTKEELEQKEWSEWFEGGQNISKDLIEGSWIQYKLALGAINSVRTPRLTKVSVNFTGK